MEGYATATATAAWPWHWEVGCHLHDLFDVARKPNPIAGK